MDKSKIITRLRRMEGQVRGIQKMVDSDRSFEELIVQLQALKSACASLIINLIEEKFQPSETGLDLKPEDAAAILRLLKS